ncbi:hypothetical protein [Altererythrobacter sp. ZODW24]|uniref:hypothetical protein n=1 Tax=Altererythrobacter sp. ZODW24 TaxID=2185142 RepID=UPI000DF7A5F3|nr:hypothetical protein [Altererythrobacter sp. ZODW24]
MNLQNAAVATAILAALSSTAAQANGPVVYVKHVGAKPTIVVDGVGGKYDRVITDKIDFYLKLIGDRPKGAVGDGFGSIKVEGRSVSVESAELHKTHLVRTPVMDLRAWRAVNERVSPIKLCNDELSYQKGAARKKFLKEGRTIWRHSAYEISGSARWSFRKRDGAVNVNTYRKTYDAKPWLLGVNVKCKPIGGKATQTTTTALDPSQLPPAKKRKPTISNLALQINPMNIQRVGKWMCPTQLRLSGRIDVIRPFSGDSIFVGPRWLSRKTKVKFQSAKGRYITATYTINWQRTGQQSLSAGGSSKPLRQTLDFKFNIAGADGKLIRSAPKRVKIVCKKPKPGQGNNAPGGLTR